MSSADGGAHPTWLGRWRRDPGRSVVEFLGGILSLAVAYVALVVATLSWCIPDSCETSVAGIAAGTAVFAASSAAALRWLSLGLTPWRRALTVGAAVAVALVVYELVDRSLG